MYLAENPEIAKKHEDLINPENGDPVEAVSDSGTETL
jgi:hypothetical protein